MSLSAEQQAQLLGLRHTLDARFVRIRESLAAATLSSIDAEMITGAHLADTAQAVRDDIEKMLTELDHWAFFLVPRIQEYAEDHLTNLEMLLVLTENPALIEALKNERAAWITLLNRCIEEMKVD